MAIKTKIIVPIYEFDLWLTTGRTLKEAIFKLPDELKSQYEKGDEDCQGVSYCEYPIYGVSFSECSIKPGIIHHEIGHVCRGMMEDIGFKITADNDEPLAWLEDWVSDRIYEELGSCFLPSS